jgi:hypothetical protein
MLWRVRSKLVNLAARFGFIVRRQKPYDQYAHILHMLRPVATGHGLVRAGGDGDGGYLIPDDLEGVTTCFSPGVERMVAFEEDMLARGMRVFQIDASIEDTPLKHPRNHFERKFLGIRSVGQYVTLDDWVARHVPSADEDLILQMDIEGAEWLCLAQVSEATLLRFRIIAIELHNLAMIADPLMPDIYTPVLDRLSEHFDVVHLHANNFARVLTSPEIDLPDVVEVTYLRKDRSTTRSPVASLPHPLDQQNSASFRPVEIPEQMYRTAPHHP